MKRLISITRINKTPGFDVIRRKVVEELPDKDIRFTTILFNVIFRIQHFLSNWPK